MKRKCNPNRRVGLVLALAAALAGVHSGCDSGKTSGLPSAGSGGTNASGGGGAGGGSGAGAGGGVSNGGATGGSGGSTGSTGMISGSGGSTTPDGGGPVPEADVGADVAADAAPTGGIALSLYNIIVGKPAKGFDPIVADMNRVEMPPRFTLQANVPIGTKSVAFDVAGKRVNIDDAAPFLLGDAAAGPAPWAVGAGSYDVIVSAFSGSGGQGELLGRLSKSLRILSTGMDPAFVKQSDAENLAWISANVANVLVPKTFTSSSGHVLPYRIYTPKFVSPSVKYPLFMFLIGAAERGSNNETYRNLGMSGTNQLFVGPRSIVSPNMQQEFPSFVIIPQCASNENWRGTESEKASFELMDKLLKDPAMPLDPDRVYLTGLSMGGEGTWDFVVRRPTAFACAAPLSGLYADTSKAAGIKDVPFWVFHSMADEQNGFDNSRRMVDAMKAANAPVIKFTIYNTERHVASFMRVWTMELDLLPWMFAWTRR